MSLCDICTRPGRCCSGLNLNGGEFMRGETALEALAGLASVWATAPDKGPDEAELGLPFIPLFQGHDGAWFFWCPNLTREGRCGDYENRPFACRHYQPGMDTLCALVTNKLTEGMYTPRLEYAHA